ncbi:hypothetical protein TNCV_3317011 [Trichonephila clavipes]|nr:hypothetical protein TNCV_3317011 [Trichonephila clavipes]
MGVHYLPKLQRPGCLLHKLLPYAHVMSSIPVPLKTRRVGQRCTLNLSRAETSSQYHNWGSKDYEEEFVRAQLSVILEERFERESEEKIARQHAIEQEQREFELEKMRLEIERSRSDSEKLSPLKTSVSDIRDGDIVLFLTLFERQAKRIGVEKTNWVSSLLARMPSDITQLIARESEDRLDNYDYIK